MNQNCFQNSCIWSHTYALTRDEEAYLKELAQKVETLSAAVKGCAWAALHLTGNHEALNQNLRHWDIASLYKMFVILDAPRQAKQLAKKIESIERDHPHLKLKEEEGGEDDENNQNMDNDSSHDSSHEKNRDIDMGDVPLKKKRPGKIDLLRKKYKKIRQELQNRCHGKECADNRDASLISELLESTSVSGALARKVRTQWAPTLQPDYLEFDMLEMPNKTVWRFVADLAHFKPKDFTVPYFLADVFGEPIPEDSFVFVMRKLLDTTDDEEGNNRVNSFRAVAERFPQIYKSYAFLRTKHHLMQSPEIVELLAANIPVDTAIWYFEELYQTSKKVPKILEPRLQSPDFLTTAVQSDSKVFKYGKLLERILTFQKLHQTAMANLLVKIANYRLNLLKEQYVDNVHQKRVAVFGDASSSMTTAIEAAAIIAGIVSTCLEGELSFFERRLVPSPYPKPSTVAETLEICRQIRANGCTSLAAALWPYCEQVKVVDTIVLVTDEWENTRCQGYYFAELLKAYREKVNPQVVLVIVRVGEGCEWFQQSLASNGIEATTIIIDGFRPDMTKFDALLGEIALASRANSTSNDDCQGKVVADEVEDMEEGDFVMIE